MPMGNGAPFPEETGTQTSQEEFAQKLSGKKTAAQIAAVLKPAGVNNDLANKTQYWVTINRQPLPTGGTVYNVTKLRN